MKEQMTKAEILKSIQEGRAAFEALLGELSEAQMTAPELDGGWSVKDVTAHVAAWERLMTGWVEASLRGEKPDRPAPDEDWDDLDQVNDQLHRAHKDRPLEEVLEDFHATHQKTLATLEGMSEADLTDPERFAWRKGDPMWHMVAANTWWHYQEHAEAIREWLAGEN